MYTRYLLECPGLASLLGSGRSFCCVGPKTYKNFLVLVLCNFSETWLETSQEKLTRRCLREDSTLVPGILEAAWLQRIYENLTRADSEAFSRPLGLRKPIASVGREASRGRSDKLCKLTSVASLHSAPSHPVPVHSEHGCARRLTSMHLFLDVNQSDLL